MKARFLFWTGKNPSELPFKDVLAFVEYSEEIFEEFAEMIEGSVANGVAEVVDQIDL